MKFFLVSGPKRPWAARTKSTALPQHNAANQTTTEPLRALTALRGLAAWWVVGFHFKEALPASIKPLLISVLAPGYLAVDLFFILSGYVIALNYLSWFIGMRFDAIRYRQFLARRLARIYPLHLAILLAFLINPLAVLLLSPHGPPTDLRWGYFALSVVLVQEWGFVHGLSWNIPAWSISAEWLAYIMFPMLAVVFSTIAPERGRALLCAALLLAVLAIFAAASSTVGLGYGAEWFGLARCMLEFSTGLCLAAVCSGRTRPEIESRFALSAAAACFAAYALLPISDYTVMPLGFALLVYGLSDERGGVARFLRWAPLQWLGVVSYSTYLVHYLLKIWVKFMFVRPGVPEGVPFLAYLTLVLLASAVLHRWVERPGQSFLRSLIARDHASALR